MDSTLDVTPEGSLVNLPAAIGGDKGFRREQQAQEASEIEIRGTHFYHYVTNSGDSLYLCKDGTQKRHQ